MSVTLGKFFDLGEHEGRFHPVGVKNYHQFLDEIKAVVPLHRITNEDVRTYLDNKELNEYESDVNRLNEWLSKCAAERRGAEISADHFPTWGIFGFKTLLIKIAERKVEREKQLAEQKRLDDQIRQSEVLYQRHLDYMNAAIKEFKRQLRSERKPPFEYPPQLSPYRPEEWCDLRLPTDEEIRRWAEPNIQQKIPRLLHNHIAWEHEYEFLLIPRAEYELLGVSSLSWCFDVSVLVTVNFRLMNRFVKVNKGICEFTMKVVAEELGSCYLGPVEWGYYEGFSTPIRLLSLFPTGKLEDPGIEVIGQSDSLIRFSVQGFDDGVVEINPLFREFIIDVTKGRTLSKGLLAAGVVDKLTTKLIEAKLNNPPPQPAHTQAIQNPISDDNSDVSAALKVLGYKKDEISQMITATKFFSGMSLEEKVQAILKSFGDSN